MNLHSCPPLRAWITPSQCDYNKALACRASRKPKGDPLRIRAWDQMHNCPACPGVVALNAAPPRDMPEIRSRPPARKSKQRARQTFAGEQQRRSTVQYDIGEVITVRELMELTGQSQKSIWGKLSHRRIRPVGEHQIGRVAHYPKRQAIEACGGVMS